MINGVVTVGTDLLKVVPPTHLSQAPEHQVSTAYAQGQLVHWSSTSYAMCLIAGTTHTAKPAFNPNATFTDGTVTWRPILPRDRKGLTLINTHAAAIIYLGIGGSIAAGAGVRLNPAGGSLTLSGDSRIQCAVFAIASAAGATLAFSEW